MLQYTAKDPYKKPESLFSSFCFSLSSSCESVFRNETLAELVLPALNRSAPKLDEYEFKSIHAEAGYVKTHDRAELETIELTPFSEMKKAEKDKYYIIKYNGNNSLCQDTLSKLSSDAKKLESVVVGFNYRGVANSKKRPGRFSELVIDGIAQVQRLLSKGVDPEKITLDGLSLGGAVAVMTAYYFHLRNQKVYLWVDRSLSSISSVPAGQIRAKVESEFMGSLAECSAQATSKMLLLSTGWEEYIANAYLAIPADYKSYTVIAKRSDKTHSTGDEVMLGNAALHYGVKDVEKRYGIKTGHKFLSFTPRGGHCDDRNELISKTNPQVNSQEAFENFVMKHKRP